MDASKSTHPRALNVTLAISIAHHAQSGWNGAELARDLEAAAAFLHLSPDDAIGRIHRTAVLAARAWRWYGTLPAAALLPLLPPPDEPAPRPPVPTAAPVAAPRTSQEWLGWALGTLRREAGLGRVLFALASPDRQSLKAKLAEGIAPDSPLADFTLNLSGHSLFAQLLSKPQSVWLHDANRDNLRPFINADMTRLIGHGDFFAMSIFLKDKPLGLLYADAREGARANLDEASYRAFKQVGACLSDGLLRLMSQNPAGTA